MNATRNDKVLAEVLNLINTRGMASVYIEWTDEDGKEQRESAKLFEIDEDYLGGKVYGGAEFGVQIDDITLIQLI